MMLGVYSLIKKKNEANGKMRQAVPNSKHTVTFLYFLDLSQQALNKWPPGALLLKGSRGNEIEYYAANFILHWGVRGGWGLADLPE